MAELDTPRSSYTGYLEIDPVVRIAGHLRIEAEIEGGIVKGVHVTSNAYRGNDQILKGRDPRDAHHFVARMSGLGGYANALASVRSIEGLLTATIPENALYIRNLVMGMQFVHDHIMNFYQFGMLDWVDVVVATKAEPDKAIEKSKDFSTRKYSVDELRRFQIKMKNFLDSRQLGPLSSAYFIDGHPAYYLDPETNLIISYHYLEALQILRKVARAIAIFGGKTPYPMFLIPGGVTCYGALSTRSIDEFESLYREVMIFLRDVYIPDMLLLASEYKDWISFGGNGNLISYGEFPNFSSNDQKGVANLIAPGVILDKNLTTLHDLDLNKIEEDAVHSWYSRKDVHHPSQGIGNPSFTYAGDQQKYSWISALRYAGLPMETGSLASVMTSYVAGVKPFVDGLNIVMRILSIDAGNMFSTLGRIVARGVETFVIAEQMPAWIGELRKNIGRGDKKIAVGVKIPENANLIGMSTGSSGGVAQWMSIRNGKIDSFRLLTSADWNFGPTCFRRMHGVLENALIGTPISDPTRPVEILRTIHSFAPCI